MENNLIFRGINLLDNLANIFRFEVNKNNHYDSIVKFGVVFFERNKVLIIEKLRKEIEDFISSLEINEEPIFSELTDNELLVFLFKIFKTIKYEQHKKHSNIILLKYNKGIMTIGFNNLANVCRGKIIDINTKQILSYGFDKFFNVNEVDNTMEDKIQEKLTKANYILLTEKKDGSTIIVTKDKDYGVFITTNGMFENEQVSVAKDLMQNTYTNFENGLRIGYTYVFEIVYPENSIVVNYGQERSLTLIGLRNLETGRLLSYDKMKSFAKEIGTPVIESVQFTSVDELLALSSGLINANKEGWVLRIENNEEQFLTKIKLKEYFELHRCIVSTNLNTLFPLVINNTYDDYLPTLSNDSKIVFLKKIMDILENLNEIEDKANKKRLEIERFSKEEISLIKKDKNHPQYKEVIEFIIYLNNNCFTIVDKMVKNYFLSNKEMEDVIYDIKLSDYKKYVEI